MVIEAVCIRIQQMGCVQIHMTTTFKGRVEEEEQQRILSRKGDFGKENMILREQAGDAGTGKQ